MAYDNLKKLIHLAELIESCSEKLNISSSELERRLKDVLLTKFDRKLEAESHDLVKGNQYLEYEVTKSNREKQQLLKQRNLFEQEIEQIKASNEIDKKDIQKLEIQIKQLKEENIGLKAEKEKKKMEHKSISKDNDIIKYDLNMLNAKSQQENNPEIKYMHVIVTVVSILGIIIAIYIILSDKK